MHLLNQQIKLLISPLYCQASLDDAVDMRELTKLMEGIREAIAGKNGYQCISLLSIDSHKYDTDAYRPYIISFKKAFEQKLYEQCVSFLKEKRESDPLYFDYWLNDYADSVANWLGYIYDPLCKEDFRFSSEEKALQNEYALFNRYLMDGKWAETFPYFTKLAADERITANTRSILEANAGLVQLYWMSNKELSVMHFNKAKELDPENYIAHRCLGEYSLEKLDFETARTYFLNAVSVQPNDTSNYLLVGDSYSKEEKYNIAEKWYMDAYKKNFLNANIYAKLLELYSFEKYKNKDSYSLDEWIKRSQQTIQNGTYDNELYENLRAIGNVFGKKGNGEEGRKYYDKAIELQPGLTGAILDKAYSFGIENEYVIAGETFRQAMRDGENMGAYNADAYWGLGWLCEKQKKNTEAIEYYKKCMDARPAWEERICNLTGYLHFKLKEYKAAAECYDKAINFNPSEQVYWDNLKDAIDKSGDEEMERHYLLKAVELNPHLAEHHNKLGIFYYKKGLFAESVACYSKAIELSPDKAVYYENRALSLEKNTDVQNAIIDYKKAYELERDAVLANKLGVLMFEKGDYSEAIQYYKEALAGDDNNALYYGNMALAFEYDNHINEAIENYKKSININEGSGQYQNRLGIIYYKQGTYDEARKYYEEALQIDKDNPTYLENLAMVYYKQEDWENARKTFQKKALLVTDDEYILCLLAEINIRLADFDTALENLNEALAIHPGVLEYLTSKAMILERKKLYYDAIEVYKELLVNKPENEQFLNRLGIMHYNIGVEGNIEHLEQAIQCYQKAIDIKPAAVYYQNIGMAYEKMNDYENAEKAYLKSIELEPGNPDYLNYTGVFYHIHLQNAVKALEYYKKAIASKDTEAVYYQNLGLAYKNLQTYPEAEEAYLKSLELEPSKAGYQYEVGTFYFDEGDDEKALPYFRKAAMLEPENNTYKKVLESLVAKIAPENNAFPFYNNAPKDSGSQQISSSN